MSNIYLCCNCAAAAANAASNATHARNECDALITGIICLSIIVVVGIAAFTVLRWHKKELEANTSLSNTDDGSSGNDDAAKKHYIDKLLNLLEAQTKSDAKLDKDACIIYENTLRGLAKMDERKPNSSNQQPDIKRQ